jgi:hypothetical protein
LKAATYQNSRVLLSRLDKCLAALEKYSGTKWGGDKIASSEIGSKVLRIIIPEGGMTAVQREAFETATRIAKSKDIRLVVTVF